MPGVGLGHRGQHAGPVVDVQRDVVAGQRLPHRHDRQARVGGRVRAAGAGQPVPGHRDQVAEHGARGRRAARARAVEHQAARGLRLHEHRVVGLADRGQRVRARDHRRVRPDRDARVAALADGQQLDHPAQRAGAADVGRGDFGDALAVHVGRGDRRVEGQAGQDGGLGRGVEPLHVRGRVGLGVAQGLGLLERLGEAGAGGVHPVQDVVGGAVDDAEHPVHRVAGQRLAQRPQQRDGPGHRGLVVQVGPVLPGRAVDLRPALGQQGLVRGDHGLAGLQRGQHQRPGRLDAADDLDHDVHVRAADQRLGIRREQGGVDRGVPAVPDPAHRDAGQLEPGADPQGQVVGLLGQQPGHLGPDHPAAEQGDLQRAAGHPTSSLSRSSRVSRRTITAGSAPSPDRDHRGARHVVVVAGQRPAVGAGGRDGQQVA